MSNKVIEQHLENAVQEHSMKVDRLKNESIDCNVRKYMQRKIKKLIAVKQRC